MSHDDRTTEWETWWPRLYAGDGLPSPYVADDGASYIRAGAYLSGPGEVWEWGCATTWGKRFIGAPYQGFDGSTDVERWGGHGGVDLRTFRPEVAPPKAIMRHVLEHNWEWRDILRNFMQTGFTELAVLILFIPPEVGDDRDNPEWRFDDLVPALTIDDTDLAAILTDDPNVTVWRDDMFTRCEPVDHEVLYFMERHPAT